ncbi:hypothetical protein Nepgr_013427 [Nepenthes gracilis]|uniref:Uncharacterized protein n=1 Tax=Nepenthes gracilis TaxID=150966 RepID=A0AAD3SIY8_NEPGR|nr:hypothetical protein Nepgr_013427 [Nepenthes gracilis]
MFPAIPLACSWRRRPLPKVFCCGSLQGYDAAGNFAGVGARALLQLPRVLLLLETFGGCSPDVARGRLLEVLGAMAHMLLAGFCCQISGNMLLPLLMHAWLLRISCTIQLDDADIAVLSLCYVEMLRRMLAVISGTVVCALVFEMLDCFCSMLRPLFLLMNSRSHTLILLAFAAVPAMSRPHLHTAVWFGDMGWILQAVYCDPDDVGICKLMCSNLKKGCLLVGFTKILKQVLSCMWVAGKWLAPLLHIIVDVDDVAGDG